MQKYKRLLSALLLLSLMLVSLLGNMAYADEIKVYVGGQPIGVDIKSKGVIVLGKCDVHTAEGFVSTVEKSDIQNGDVITHLNGDEVNSVADISAFLNGKKYIGGEVSVTVIRGKRTHQTTVSPAIDKTTGGYKLGLWVKEDTVGVGTLTYVMPESKQFGALGHAVTDGDTGCKVEPLSGKVYGANITGVIRGERGRAGELKGAFTNTDSPLGSVSKNTAEGIFGVLNQKPDCSLYPEPVSIAKKKEIRTGKATIISTVSDNTPREYSIEIVKLCFHAKGADKGMVIKITDQSLLEATGGIVQGMSGSPIMQNGKLIGAVTHVFINDPTRGYGIFIENMLRAAA